MKESLEDGELLVAFAARNALKPRDLDDAELDTLLASVAEGRKAFDSGSLDSTTEATLLNNLRHLAIAFLPVTAGSIRDSSCEGLGAGRRYFFWGVPISHAEAAVRMFAIVSIVALLWLLAAQIVWLAGYDLVNRWRALEKEEEVAQVKLRAARRTAEPSPTPSPPSKDATKTGDSDDQVNRRIQTDELMDLLDDQANRKLQKEALMHLILRWWNRFGVVLHNQPKPRPSPPATAAAGPEATTNPMSTGTMPPAESSPRATPEPTPGTQALSSSDETIDEDLQRKIGTLVAVEAEVNIIQTYVLPLLYGLLGSCAYVLRQLTLEIRARTFRRELGISYWLHIFLGVLAGLAIGWFLRPEVGEDGLIRGLTPFALSFLAGYSVEVLFAAMDRLVAAFGPTTAEKS